MFAFWIPLKACELLHLSLIWARSIFDWRLTRKIQCSVRCYGGIRSVNNRFTRFRPPNESMVLWLLVRRLTVRFPCCLLTGNMTSLKSVIDELASQAWPRVSGLRLQQNFVSVHLARVRSDVVVACLGTGCWICEPRHLVIRASCPGWHANCNVCSAQTEVI